MSNDKPTPADRFRAGVVEHLKPLTAELVPVLRRLIEYPYPPEVANLDFEVFCDGFTDGFPVRVFFMDAHNGELFVYRGSQAEYPCDVNPELLKVEHVYPREFAAAFKEEDDTLDTFTLAGDALIPWFAECWEAAGGRRFNRGAQIGLHDEFRRFDLVRMKWVKD